MSLELKKYFSDILTSISHIQSFTSGIHSINEYSSNLILKRAVERELEIIGEALNKSLSIDGDLRVSNARKIINTRNRIIHGYDKVDDAVIWAVVIKHLPTLKSEVEILLK
ncbi:MAG TPA: HepT-like ribonuclease domain-containing protein [Bacteroidia bacterium]|jgi:uncharacterized protein with HEPN domain|nr:HepT-like ribonuclease domain-containing protein [Bacteroidia bacterium]